MTLIPHKNETLVAPITALQALSRLSLVTQPAGLSQSHKSPDILFVGHIGKSSFRISRKVNYPQNYLPIIKGKIEGSSRGCIIFIKYRLFFSSILFFTFWTGMTMLIGLFFIFFPKEYGYAIIAFSSGVANYVVTLLNFNKQVKLSRAALDEALNMSA
ncbi:hypothetical protein JMN32_25535 [Fulvivirga sp. 29W222]|uniref:Uncharacterized protein n=1 Tax=Fulvivirga marina TaxID=2494733 RepID=A0A937G3D8_9BACT|nr:hypothetical protein [Fulvivirga marina]MBL6449698.1 hypothetical protein [Fulvivirga marina]